MKHFLHIAHVVDDAMGILVIELEDESGQVVFLIEGLFSLAATVWLSDCIGYAGAFCVVGAFYLVAFLLFLLFRKPLVERPLVKFLTDVLMDR